MQRDILSLQFLELCEFRGMPAGGIAVLKLPADADLEPGVAELAAFWWP